MRWHIPCISSLFLMACLACGGGTDPGPEPRAPEPDAAVCNCTTSVTDYLPQNVVGYDFRKSSILTSPYLEVTNNCEYIGEKAVSGGCGYQDLDSMAWLYEDGFIALAQFAPDYEGWTCSFTKEGSGALDMYTSTVCVQKPEEIRDNPEECGCPFIETFTERLRPVNQVNRIPPGETRSVTAACVEGDTVIGGSCYFDAGIQGSVISIYESGPVPGENAWRCGWDNDAVNYEDNGHVVVQCLREPHPNSLPEDVPVLDRIHQVENSKVIPAGDYEIVTASCPAGDFLISGGCTLEGLDGADHDLLMLRASIVEPGVGPENTWECAWYNPPGTVPIATGRATAVCVTPPELVMQQPQQ